MTSVRVCSNSHGSALLQQHPSNDHRVLAERVVDAAKNDGRGVKGHCEVARQSVPNVHGEGGRKTELVVGAPALSSPSFFTHSPCSWYCWFRLIRVGRVTLRPSDLKSRTTPPVTWTWLAIDLTSWRKFTCWVSRAPHE